VLTRRLLDRLAEIIKRRAEEYNRRLFGTRFGGKDMPTASGEDPLPASIVHLSFALGKAEAVLKEEEWKQVTWDQLEASTQLELSEVEKRQIEAAELSAYTEFRGLADDIQDGLFRKLSQATGKVVTEAQVRGTIVDKVQLGVEANSSYQTVAKELVGDLKEQKRSWTRVASTEMHSARQRGVAQTIRAGEGIYQDADGDDSRVAVVPAGDACDDCVRLYIEGGKPKIFRLSELMANEGTNYIRPWRQNAGPVVPPLHPNSVVGYATVEGNTLAATRMSYTGQIREVKTAQGHTLSVTPNHPVATIRGFVPACQVQEGDYLLSYGRGIEQNEVSRLSFMSGSPIFPPKDDQYGPTKIEKVFHSLEAVFEPVTVKRLGLEFHGDAAYGDSDIDIVYVDSKLRDRTKPTILDQIKCLLFETAKFSTYHILHQRLGASLLVGGSVFPSFPVVSCFDEVLASSFKPSNTLRIGSTACLDAVLLEMSGEFAARDASFCRELQERLPSLVSQDEVIKVRDFSYSGHVYDLQTVSEVIVAEGLIISNCFCRLQYIPDGFGWDDKGRFTMIEKSVDVLEQMQKAIDHQPHSLLNSAMESLPSKDYVYKIQDPEELERLIPRLDRLQQMYSHNFEVYQRIDDLLHAAYGHYAVMAGQDPSLLEKEVTNA
jgi:hypothetical protein